MLSCNSASGRLMSKLPCFQIKKIFSINLGGKSIGLTKGLPYGAFMRQVIYDITVRGQLDQMKAKWKNRIPNCAPVKNTGKPLSLKKLSSIFIFIQCGFFLAVISFIFEKIFHFIMPNTSIKCYKQQMAMVKLKIYIEELKEITIRKKAKYPKLLSLMKDVQKIEEKSYSF